MDSLKTMVGLTEKADEYFIEMTVDRYESLADYKKVIVFAYVYHYLKHVEARGKFILIDEITEEFNGIEYEKRKEIFGEIYSKFARAWNKFITLSPDGQKATQQELEAMFGIELSFSSGQDVWVATHRGDIIAYLRDHVNASVGEKKDDKTE
jgi:F0F1-type ATP synthase delta subunit